VYLTDLGKEKRRIAKVVVKEFNQHLEAHLSERERNQLIKTLSKLNVLALNYEPTLPVQQP